MDGADTPCIRRLPLFFSSRAGSLDVGLRHEPRRDAGDRDSRDALLHSTLSGSESKQTLVTTPTLILAWQHPLRPQTLLLPTLFALTSSPCPPVRERSSQHLVRSCTLRVVLIIILASRSLGPGRTTVPHGPVQRDR